MDPEVLAAIITAGPVVIVAVLTIALNAVLENRRDRRREERQRSELEAQRTEASRLRAVEYLHQRTERSYADRRDAIFELLLEVDRTADDAGNKQLDTVGTPYEGLAPADVLDGLELDRYTTGLRRALARVDLLASANSRVAAKNLVEIASRGLLEWKWEGFDSAREDFIVAARRDDLALPEFEVTNNAP